MREAVKRLNAEYGFKLSEEEIELIAEQAEAATGYSSHLMMSISLGSCQS